MDKKPSKHFKGAPIFIALFMLFGAILGILVAENTDKAIRWVTSCKSITCGGR